jgi:hypothetical protein
MSKYSSWFPWIATLPLAISACSTSPSTTPTTPDVAVADVAVTDVAADTETTPDVVAVPDVITTPDVVAVPDVMAMMDVISRPDVMTADAATDRTAVTDAAPDMLAMVGPYPAGPYGRAMGNVLANLEWEGYVNLDGAVVSSMLTYGPTSMQAIRETGRRYGLVHLSEFF